MTTPTTDQPLGPYIADPLGSLCAASASEIATFRSALRRPGNNRDLAVATLVVYAQSEGLCGYDPSSFEAFNGAPTSVIKGVVSSSTKELIEAGVLVKGISPFESFLGIFPSHAFISATLADRSIFQFLSQPETRHLTKLSTAITDSSQAELEKRWLLKIASAFLYVPHGDAVQTSHLYKLLPDFEGREKRVPSLLAQLHDKELITHVKAEGVSEIFLNPGLLDRLEDGTLVEQLKDPRRKPEPFPFIVKHAREVDERVSSGAHLTSKPSTSAPIKRSVKGTSPALRQALEAATTTLPETGGNNAGREARAAILNAVKNSPTALTTAQLITELSALNIKEPAFRYHIKLLSEEGYIRLEGKGRHAPIVLQPRVKQ